METEFCKVVELRVDIVFSDSVWIWTVTNLPYITEQDFLVSDGRKAETRDFEWVSEWASRFLTTHRHN